MKKGFLVQMHLHTMESSTCAVSSAADMARACKQAGYSALVVTDHFANGDLRYPPGASWQEKVQCQLKGYLAAKAEGDTIGLKVFFGWETAHPEGPEYLTYGLNEEFLLDNPDIADVPFREYLRRVRAAGAFVSQAHPFRTGYYIPQFDPDPTCVEAFEVFNGGNPRAENELALKMAVEHGLICTAGSDAHHSESVARGAMLLPEPVYDICELMCALKEGSAQVVEQL